MPLLFRSSQGPWSVWTCECCGEAVKFTNSQERDWTRAPKLYIAHHAPLGCPWERKGEVYDFIAEPPKSPATPPQKSAPLTDGWDEKTPVERTEGLAEVWDEELSQWLKDMEEP